MEIVFESLNRRESIRRRKQNPKHNNKTEKIVFIIKKLQFFYILFHRYLFLKYNNQIFFVFHVLCSLIGSNQLFSSVDDLTNLFRRKGEKFNFRFTSEKSLRIYVIDSVDGFWVYYVNSEKDLLRIEFHLDSCKLKKLG